MTVDHRCSLLPSGHSDVDQMASREKSTITRSPAYVYVRPHVYHQHWNWRTALHLQSYRQVNSKVGPGFGM